MSVTFVCIPSSFNFLTTFNPSGIMGILTISRMIPAGLPFSFESSVGFVVMPSTKPISLYFLIDSIFAVSRKIFMLFSAPASCFKHRLYYFSCSQTIVLQEHIDFLITCRFAKYVVDSNAFDGYRVGFANNFRHYTSKASNDIVLLSCSYGTRLLGASIY